MSGLIAVYAGFCCTSTAVIPVIGKTEESFRVGDDFLGLLHYFTLFEALHIEDKSL
jgi:hypothetical protein